MKIILFLLLLFFFMSSTQALTFSGGKDNIVHQVAAEVLKRAYERAGLNPQFIFMPHQKSLQQSNAGNTDGEICRKKNINMKFPNLVQIPVVINYVEGIAFSKDHLIELNKWSDLSHYKIAIVRGTKFIEEGTQGMDRIMAMGFKEAFELLQNNEVDLVVSPKTTGLFFIYKYNYKNIRPVGAVLQKINLYHFVNEKKIVLFPLITPVLEEMSRSGEIKYIRGAYLNKVLGL